jgi:hypothetical protein
VPEQCMQHVQEYSSRWQQLTPLCSLLHPRTRLCWDQNDCRKASAMLRATLEWRQQNGVGEWQPLTGVGRKRAACLGGLC